MCSLTITPRIYALTGSMTLVKARVLRSKQFAQQKDNSLSNTVGGGNGGGEEEGIPPLVPVESLMGMSSTSSKPTFVSLLGLLARNPSNLAEFFLEDQHARVPLDLSRAVCECDDENIHDDNHWNNHYRNLRVAFSVREWR